MTIKKVIGIPSGSIKFQKLEELNRIETSKIDGVITSDMQQINYDDMVMLFTNSCRIYNMNMKRIEALIAHG